MTKSMVIKKYGNRRLYDTEQSRYITLDELAELVRKSPDVQVVDAKSGADLTQSTLAHIILESRGAARLLPVPLLRQLVRMEDDSLGEFFGLYMSNALDFYLRMKQGVQMMMPMGPFNPMANPFLTGFGQPAAPPQGPPSTGPADEFDPRKDELAQLRRELDELKEALRGSSE